MLTKLFLFYQISSKRSHGLRELGEELGKCVSKPTKAVGTCYIADKFKAMQLILNNHCTYMSHLEELCITDTPRAEIRGYLRKWCGTNYPLIFMYLDMLSPIHRQSLSEQKE